MSGRTAKLLRRLAAAAPRRMKLQGYTFEAIRDSYLKLDPAGRALFKREALSALRRETP